MNRCFWISLGLLCLCWSGVSAQKVTFYKDIAPIIYENCVPCHREGGSAPFPLSSYKDVAKRANFIQMITEERYMPPWKANPDYRSFADEKRLTDEELALIKKWAADKAPKGAKKHAPALPKFQSGSQVLGEPDMVLEMPRPFEVPGTNQHTFICYKVPYELPKDTFVRAIEFVPGNRKLVHHASYQILAVPPGADMYNSPDYFVFSEDSINAIDDTHDYAYFKLVDEQGRQPFETFHNGWLPGASPQYYPDGMGFYLPKKGVLLIRNLHYSPTPIPATDKSKVHLYFSKKPVERTIRFATFKPTNLDHEEEHFIEPDSIAEHELIVRLNSAVSILNINPHMHQIGDYFKAYALTPGGDTIPLVEVKKWDFNWQEFYRFKKMLHLPKGTIIHAVATFDNTSDNPANPFYPPKRIYFERGSMEETEEMMRLTFIFLPYQKGDEEVSLEQLWPPQ